MECIFKNYPKNRKELPEEYQKIYNQHYYENREGKTTISHVAQKMEGWMHKKIAQTAFYDKHTLDIGAGTLNQLKYEAVSEVYDIVEPFSELYQKSEYYDLITGFYTDISEIPNSKKYDRIISCASFEHICNLPEVVESCTNLLSENGVLCVAIPNEGRFLWKFAYKMTTGREFKKRFGLDYSVLMNYEHVNTADEIENVLKYYFINVQQKLLGIGKDFSFYRYYQCSGVKSIK